MKWWDDLWLNEGFATYAASLAMDGIKIVNWDVWTDFIHSETDRGMCLDSLKSSHPIKVEVYDPHDIDQIFDGISYSKSASLLRMLEKFLGSQKFRNRISEYLKKYRESNATTQNLWNVLSDEKINVAEVMKNWIELKGFPLIRAIENEGQVTIIQEKFKANPNDGENSDSQWMIPMSILYEKTPSEFLIKEKEESIFVEGDYKLNYDGSSFVRVSYEPFKNILENEHDVRDRLTFINDVISLTFASYIKIDYFINLLKYFKDEKNFEVMNSVVGGLYTLREIFPEKYGLINKMIINLFDHRRIDNYMFEVDGSEVDEINQSSFNSLIVNTLVNCGDEKTINELADLYSEFKKNSRAVHPIFRSSMYKSVIIRDGKYDEIFNIYLNGQVSDKIYALLSLGYNEKFLNKYLEELIKDNVKLQDKIYITAGAMALREGKKISREFFIKNYDEILNSYKQSTILLSYSIEHIFSSCITDEELENCKNFLLNINSIGMERAINQTIEKSEIKNRFRKLNIDYFN